MITAKRLKHAILTLLLCTLAGSLLTACNEQNPYDDQNIGEADKPFDTDPSSGLTRIALYASKPIQGLYYVCNGQAKGRSYTQPVRNASQLVATNVNKDNIPVARCGNDATQVTFYLGVRNQLATNKAVKIGSIKLPNITVSGTDGKVRHDVVSGKLSQAPVYLSYSMADLQNSPNRVNVAAAFDAQGNCKANREDACAIVYKTALLMAIDESQSSEGVLDISLDDSHLMADSATYASKGFNQSSYSQFKVDWQPYVTAAGGALPATITSVFPYAGNPNASAAENILQGAGRLNAGTYKLTVTNQITSNVQTKNRLAGRAWAYPDGSLAGIGIYNKDPNNVCSAEIGALESGGVPTSQEWADFLVCIMQNKTGANYFILTGAQNNNPRITPDNTLADIQLSFLKPGSTQHPALTGRLFNGFLYNGATLSGTNGNSGINRNGFSLDYPGYSLASGEKGQLTGPLPGVSSSSYPVRMNQTASIQLPPLSSVALGSLNNGDIYKIQLMRYCTDAEKNNSACQAIPQPSKEIGKSGNYATDIPGANAGSAKERPRINVYGVATSGNAIYLQFNQQTNGVWALNLYKNDCSGLVENAQGNPLKVGYAFATPSETSVDISVTLLPRDKGNVSSFPQFGAHLEGRIDLADTSWPLYRTGDDSFNDQLRAHWTDPTAYYSFEYLQTVTDYSKNSVKEMLGSLGGGAVKARKVGSCGA